jgi:hypothetical protein
LLLSGEGLKLVALGNKPSSQKEEYMIRKISFAMLTITLLTAPLVFTSGCASRRGGESRSEYAHDKDITSNIKSAFDKDPLVKSTNTRIGSLQGGVQLAGWVDNQAQKDRAGQIAASVPGVVSVHNDLIVRGQPDIMPTGR